jgi:hypothetical protein
VRISLFVKFPYVSYRYKGEEELTLNPHSELSCDDDFQDLTPEFLATPSAVPSPVATVRTKRDPSRYLQFLEARQLAEKATQKYFENLIQSNPATYEGWNLRLTVEARPKSKPGAFKVLLALIDLILTPSGAAMTQTDCRNKVHASYPEHAMFKDWTKPLSKWALAHATKRITNTVPAIASIKVNSKTSLRDIHNAAKAAFVSSSGEGQVFRPKVTVYPDCVVINDTRFKLSTNKSNGSAYATLRASQAALLNALQ